MIDAPLSGRAAEFRHCAFWAVFQNRHPGEEGRRVRHGSWFWQCGLPQFGIVIPMYVAPVQHLVGVFFGRNERLGAVAVDERPHMPALEASLRLQPAQRSTESGLGAIWRVNCFAQDNWPAMADWSVTEATRFEQAVANVLGKQR